MANGKSWIKLTGLWKNKTKNGDAMLSGNLGGARIVILKNSYKKAENHPDYNLFIAEKEDRQEVGRGQSDPPPPIEDDMPF